MAAWRRRAHEAETRLREMETAAPSPSANGAADPRTVALEQENAELRARLSAAGERTKALVEKLQFLRQQRGAGAQP
jgi:hypothetical protein